MSILIKSREKDVKVLRLFVSDINITKHLSVYYHVIFTSCCSSITLLFMQNSKRFCPVCLINLLKVWQEAIQITQSVVINTPSMLILSSFQFIINIRMIVI